MHRQQDGLTHDEEEAEQREIYSSNYVEKERSDLIIHQILHTFSAPIVDEAILMLYHIQYVL